MRAAADRHLTADTPIIDEKAKLKIALRKAEADIKALAQERDTAEAIRREIYNLASRTPDPPAWLVNPGTIGKRGTPMTMWSDWHYGERVEADEVGGVNVFNAEIAAARIKTLVETTIDLCFNHSGKSTSKYPGIVVCLGGDMISGDIHEELMATNDRTPQQCINELTDLLAWALEQMADAFGKVFVPCVVGNHGRATRKPRAKGRVYCLDATTPILTRDLRWVPAGSLTEGDPILGFEEETLHARGRRYEPAVITHAEKTIASTVKITLASGQVFYATPEHKFLAHGKKGNSAVQWISAQEMLDHARAGRKNAGTWSLDKYLPVWTEDQSRAAGYLAGVFDGEGTLAVRKGAQYSRAQISVTQYDNACLADTKTALDLLGFRYNESIVINRYDKPCHYLTLRGGVPEVLRFLGQVRPARLLAKWAKFDTDDRFMSKLFSDDIVSVEDGGFREIAVLSSSSKTYMSAGYASHNTSHEWNIYCNLERYFRKDKRIQFFIPHQSDAAFAVYDHRFLLTHGDSLGVKGGDGIIGSLGPIMRGRIKTFNAEAQIGRDFDTLIIGHWHQYLALPGLIVNNCLKGFDEYARLFLRAPYSRPSQALWFVHPKHGLTTHWQVFLEPKRDLTPVDTKWIAWEE